MKKINPQGNEPGNACVHSLRKKGLQMLLSDLPTGERHDPVPSPWFPTLWQTVLWRNQEFASPEKLGSLLGCTPEQVKKELRRMGIPAEPVVNPDWLRKGYLTVIRNNWNLLNYEQILQLLDWTPDKLAYTLKEEDFFFAKLGRFKPECPAVRYAPLTKEEEAATDRIRETIERYFSPETFRPVEKPFAFAEKFEAKKAFQGKDRFVFNFIHSYSASCGDIFLNAEELDPVPENLLQQYASMGIKGVWMHAIMYLLYPIPGAESFSTGAEKRLQNLKKLTERCARYGVKIYLYFNEPRAMTEEFYRLKPEWAGLTPASSQKRYFNCIHRSPEPLQWLENSFRSLFRDVPDLGGVFLINMSENPTHCNSNHGKVECPYCKDYPSEEFLVKILTAAEKGVHASAPDALVIAEDWAWRSRPEDTDNTAFKKKVIDLLPEKICFMSVSEWGKRTNVGGIPWYVIDYSISQVGPAEESAEVLQYAKKRGLRIFAKLQMNNSWELSAVPSIPVPYLIQEHLNNLRKIGVDGLMLSWTLGGFPGGNLELLRATPEEAAAARFTPENAEKLCRAWQCFSEAFREFPFSCPTVYNAPMNYGPKDPLYLDPTGAKSTMIGFPYDDLEDWRSCYPEEIFENQFRKLTEGWKQGLTLLDSMVPSKEEKEEYQDIWNIAHGSSCHLRSTYDQIRFVRARDASDREKMIDSVRSELKTALELHEIARQDSRIGFEASNHYYYTLSDLKEKVINLMYVLHRLS